ncbi:MAG: radical SAM protein [Deltaproteobacteria bacterium]|nr:radical SAM protein [Deltaproteobacteria bacterium]
MPALGLPYIQGALKAAGIEVRLFDLNIEIYERLDPAERDFWDPSHHFIWYEPIDQGRARAVFSRLAAFIDGFLIDAIGPGPVVVGITALATQKFPAFHLAARVKALNPEATVVIGGASCFPQYAPDEIAACPAVDYVVVGEGERAIVDLVGYVGTGARGPVPPGVLRRRNERIEEGGRRPLIRDLDLLPMPDFTGLPLDRYQDRRRIPMMWSRGCVNRCVFCIEHRIWERFRWRSASHIFREIREATERWGAGKIEANDSLFNGNISVLHELGGMLIAEGIHLPWGCEGIIRKEMAPGLLAKLKNAGCGYITYGLESASANVLRLMGKRTDLSVASRVIRDTSAAGILQKVNIMVGFPGETEDDFRSTLDFLTDNRRFLTEVNPSDGFTGIFPGTELYDRHLDFGVTFAPGMHYFWETRDGTNTLATRIERFERVLKHAAAIGLKCTYPGTELLNRDKILGDFHLNRGEHTEALRFYERHSARTGVEPDRIPGYREALR